MARAYSTENILNTKFEQLAWGPAWATAFHRPESSGVWCVWGNSGNAKTRFLIDMALELAKTYRVFYNSLEEGNRLTMQLTLKSAGVTGKVKNFLIGQETMKELDERISRRKGPQIVFIDSIQYANIRFDAFKQLARDKHSNILFIVSSQAEGKEPEGKVAKKIKFDADLKIRVEGYKAVSNGRFNPGGEYTIWDEGAAKYWGTQNNNANEN